MEEVGGEGTGFGLLEAVPDAIVIADTRGRIVFVNAQAERMFGYSKLELDGGSLEMLIPPRYRKQHVTHVAAFVASPRVRQMGKNLELLGQRKDGAEFPVEISISPLHVQGETLLISAIRDVSERKRVELERDAAMAATAEARAWLQALLDHAPVKIIAIDSAGNIQFINQTSGLTRDAMVVGAPWKRYVPVDQQAIIESAFQKVLATGVAQGYEVRGIDPPRLFAAHMGPIRNGAEIVGVVIVSQDVTDRVRAEAGLAAAQRMAAVGTLAAGVAHEINTPIQFVSDSLYFLRDAAADVFGLVDQLVAVHSAVVQGVSPTESAAAAAEAIVATDLDYMREKVPAAFERCVDGLARVAAIVRSLKEFSHPSQKEMAPVDLNRAIESTLMVASSEYKYVADVVTELGELPFVTCHLGDINQVVLNLVVNAAHAIGEIVKGTDQKGRITVRTWRDGDVAVITIADTGNGIPAQIRDRVFEPFFTTKEVGRGTGQGLALAWSIVHDKHGGELAFETAVGEGTTFVIRLPIAGRQLAA